MAALSRDGAADAVADASAAGWHGRDGHMSRAEMMDFIADCEQAGVDTSAFENLRAFVGAVDRDGDSQVSRDELAAWLKANRTFTTRHLEVIKRLIDSGAASVSSGRLYGESKYGVFEEYDFAADEPIAADTAAATNADTDSATATANRAAAVDGVVDSVSKIPGRLMRSEILSFIADCESAGVDTSAFDSQRAFIAAVDKDGNGYVDKEEFAVWLSENKSVFSTEQLTTIRETVEADRLRVPSRGYGETKYGMY